MNIIPFIQRIKWLDTLGPILLFIVADDLMEMGK